MDFQTPPSHHCIDILGGRRDCGDFRRREGVEPRVQVELDDFADELRRQEVRELRRQRLGESLAVSASVVLKTAGADNSAEVRVFGERSASSIPWKLG